MNKKDSKNDPKKDPKKGSPTPTAKAGTPSQGIKPQPVANTPKANTPANNTPQAPKITPTPNITVVTPPGTQTPTPNKFSWGG